MNLDRLNALEKRIEKVLEKRDEPQEGKQYMFTGTADDKCIANGNTWEESVVDEFDYCKPCKSQGITAEICRGEEMCLDCEEKENK